MPSFEAISSPSGTKFDHKKLETLGYHMVKTRSLHLTWAWIGTRSWQTDRQTDRITVADTRLALRAVARKNGWKSRRKTSNWRTAKISDGGWKFSASVKQDPRRRSQSQSADFDPFFTTANNNNNNNSTINDLTNRNILRLKQIQSHSIGPYLTLPYLRGGRRTRQHPALRPLGGLIAHPRKSRRL